ncbi:hypothetical protein GE09DRAFT_464500 [Coniochaeta sp. 2T2.1]|nr:hypothetical protein GE09DRAFT_464500 [Coniochaeta sp. 2T2.1]
MHFLSTIVSFAAFTAFLTPVISAPIAEPNVDTTSVVVKRGGGGLTDTAQTCYDGVKNKCDEITAKIDAAVDAKIDADLAAVIIVDLKVIVTLIVKLGVDLQAKIAAGRVKLVDVKACVAIVIAIVKLCVSILVKIKACLSVNVSASVFIEVVLKLYACIKIVIDLCIDLCLGKKGGVPVQALVLQLTACLTAFVNARDALGIHV